MSAVSQVRIELPAGTAGELHEVFETHRRIALSQDSVHSVVVTEGRINMARAALREHFGACELSSDTLIPTKIFKRVVTILNEG
jgi:hypothetical protein